MNIKQQERSNSKNFVGMVKQILEDDIGVCKAQADAIINLMIEHYAATQHHDHEPNDYYCVHKDEPPGKPVKHCRKARVKLTMFHPVDLQIIAQMGAPTTKGFRIARVCYEAQEQGGLLSHEDIAFLFAMNVSSVHRHIKKIEQQFGILVPTRGAMWDMGRAPSHFETIATCLLKGLSFRQVRAITGHSESSIERYSLQLGAVAYLRDMDASCIEIARVAKISESRTKQCSRLLDEFSDETVSQQVIETMKQRYELNGPARPRKRPSKPSSRLPKQNLHAAASQLMQQYANLPQKPADLAADELMKLLNDSFSSPRQTPPGSITIFADERLRPGMKSADLSTDRPIKPVTICLYDKQMKSIWLNTTIPKSKRLFQLMQRISKQIHDQGAVATLDLLGFLLHTPPSTLSKYIKQNEAESAEQVIRKGNTEDAGKTNSHKQTIIQMYEQGATPSEISFCHNHTSHSRDRYLETWRQIRILKDIYERNNIELSPQRMARQLRLTESLCKQYLNLADELIPHPNSNAPPF